MTNKEKYHDINIAFNLIKTVFEDTDDELWAWEYLSDALVALDKWYEEGDI